jgi:hypothetical protein
MTENAATDRFNYHWLLREQRRKEVWVSRRTYAILRLLQFFLFAEMC